MEQLLSYYFQDLHSDLGTKKEGLRSVHIGLCHAPQSLLDFWRPFLSFPTRLAVYVRILIRRYRSRTFSEVLVLYIGNYNIPL